MKSKRAREFSGWPRHSLRKAEVSTLEASDLLAMSADQLLTDSLRRWSRNRVTTVRTHQALEQTRFMLEQAAAAIQRARVTFAPLGLTRSPF